MQEDRLVIILGESKLTNVELQSLRDYRDRLIFDLILRQTRLDSSVIRKTKLLIESIDLKLLLHTPEFMN